MDAKLTKSLTDLIDETLFELDELRKSRFAAAEIKIEGPGDGIAGKPSDGDLHAKAEDKKEEEKEEKEEAKKGENEEAAKAEDKKEDEKEEEESEEHPDKKATKEKAKDIEEDAKEIKKLHKSMEESQTLMKSYVEERIKPIEEKLSTIFELVNKIAEQPVTPKGVTVKTAPLMKSDDAAVAESLSKSEVANKLFELKKSGTRVDSLDIAKVEMGQDLATIIKKYEIS